MGQPKAKWVRSGNRCQAEVGAFRLHADQAQGGASVWQHRDPEHVVCLWVERLPVPCDIVDLMRLAEAELERRLRGAAETMSGEELVAEPISSGPTHRYPACALDGCEEQSWGRGFWPGLCETHARMKERANELASTDAECKRCGGYGRHEDGCAKTGRVIVSFCLNPECDGHARKGNKCPDLCLRDSHAMPRAGVHETKVDAKPLTLQPERIVTCDEGCQRAAMPESQYCSMHAREYGVDILDRMMREDRMMRATAIAAKHTPGAEPFGSMAVAPTFRCSEETSLSIKASPCSVCGKPATVTPYHGGGGISIAYDCGCKDTAGSAWASITAS